MLALQRHRETIEELSGIKKMSYKRTKFLLCQKKIYYSKRK